MQTKYLLLPAHLTTLKLQTLSTFPSPNLAHASTAAQVNITALTMMCSFHYCPINNTTITTANGHKLKALRKGDVQIELPNGAKCTKTILREAIHAPDIAFTLISVGWLEDTKCSVTFSCGICTIHNPSSHTMATIPCANSLYCVTTPEDPPTINYVSIAMVKLTISKAHRKVGYIAPSAIKYTIAKGHIMGIQLDPESKPEFYEACAKAKVGWQPFPKELETHAMKYGERIH